MTELMGNRKPLFEPPILMASNVDFPINQFNEVRMVDYRLFHASLVVVQHNHRVADLLASPLLASLPVS